MKMVFLSHAGEDNAQAVQLRRDLRTEDIYVWRARDELHGDD